MRLIAITIAALAAATAPAAAQGGTVSVDEARAFFEDIGPRAETAVAEGDWQGIRDWMSEHVADEANIALTGTVVTAEGPVMTYDAAMRGDNLKRFGALSMTSMAPMMTAGGLSGYGAHANVQSARSLPGGVVSADVRFWEHGRLDLGAIAAVSGRGSSEAMEDPARADGTMTFESVSDCSFRVARQDGAIVITLAACETDTTM